MSVSWNLLNYPALHQQRRRRHRIITSLAGLAMGALVAGASSQAVQRSTQSLHLQHTQLQAQWHEVSQQLKLEQQQAAQRDRHRQQTQHLRQIADQHRAWAGLHEALLSEAADGTWRLTRLQLDPGQLALSGWSRDFDTLSATRHTLSAQLQAHWPPGLTPAAASSGALNAGTGTAPRPSPVEWVRQTSVSARGGSGVVGGSDPLGVEFVWASPWPTFKTMATNAKGASKGDAP